MLLTVKAESLLGRSDIPHSGEVFTISWPSTAPLLLHHCGLGKMWHALTSVEEQKYLNLGRLTAQEHGQRHPDYSYNPIEAQRQKAAHVGAHRVKGMNPKGHKVTNTLGVSGKGACSRPSPASSRVSNFTPYTVKLLQITALIQ
ncbi:uncharacterized protein LOC111865866 isoform X3 [Cryptotermes secundus]|uniref:uncharacterized protein LOC111865866 isoform X3 n=1 Tax=Cryptotermes secundus TaxID=105785 RepID=UPI000CD7C9E9|nr:uncharacterized protein LOC111865866 isoform X3 [Cryptotermes secundus]